MSEHSYNALEVFMKIAYIVDGSTELTPSIRKTENIYTLQFKSYNQSGTLEYVKNATTIESLQKQKTKQYVEPTPGIYRDLYRELKRQGFDYVICIPQSKDKSISYSNAEYASRFYKDYVLVIDSLEYGLSSFEILKNLLNDKEIEDSSITFSFEQLFEEIRKVLVNLKLLKA